MTIWNVHRLMIISASIFSGAFGVQTLRFADGQPVRTAMGAFSLAACAGLIVYFRWYQEKTGKRRPRD